jgi:hypothetical protein
LIRVADESAIMSLSGQAFLGSGREDGPLNFCLHGLRQARRRRAAGFSLAFEAAR